MIRFPHNRTKFYVEGDLKPTRYPELFFEHRGDHWRLIDGADLPKRIGIGPQYRTKAELLADLDRYAKEIYGCG